MKNKMRILFLLLVVGAMVVGCSESKDTGKTESSNEKPNNTEYVSPFTGVKMKENTMRPVLATINNDPLARPQSGLSSADIVYEFITEGDTTRYLALYQSELPAQIGPIRSARDTFVHIAKGLDAFYIAHGYSPDALKLLKAGEVDHVNGMQHDGTLFKRSTDRKAPHNSYISNDNVLAAAKNNSISMKMNKLPSLSFHETIESAKIGDKASAVVVQNGAHPTFTSTYAYDEEAGTYLQTVKDVQTVDKVNDKPIELSNIVVLEATHETIDSKGRQKIDIDSGGEGILFQAGIVKKVEWENRDGQLTPVENGTPVKLVPGKTWVHIIRTNPGIGEKVSYTP